MSACEEVYRQASHWAPKLVGALVVFSLFLLAAEGGRRIIQRLCYRAHIEKQVGSLLSQLYAYSLWGLGVLTTLGTMGVNISAMVAGLGLSGFALGFALRDAISNLLSGVLILVYRPFTVGQWIGVAGFEGEVVDINLRYTVLKKEYQHFLVPNSNVFSMPVTVMVQKPSVMDGER